MKLIPMTDFVLETLNRDVTVSYGIRNKVAEIRNYAELLKTKLKLGFFVPCDKNDVPLEEPVPFGNVDLFNRRKIEYEEAVERVLFKDYKTSQMGKNGLVLIHKNGIPPTLAIKQKDEAVEWHNIEKVEDLIGLELTDSAVKQLEL